MVKDRLRTNQIRSMQQCSSNLIWWLYQEALSSFLSMNQSQTGQDDQSIFSIAFFFSLKNVKTTSERINFSNTQNLFFVDSHSFAKTEKYENKDIIIVSFELIISNKNRFTVMKIDERFDLTKKFFSWWFIIEKKEMNFIDLYSSMLKFNRKNSHVVLKKSLISESRSFSMRIRMK